MYSFFEWLKKVQKEEAMSAAPATKPEPKTIPAPTKPKPNTRPSPWAPPNPATDQPKAEKKKLILTREVYERDVNPFVRKFASELIRNRDNPMGLNPLTAMEGEYLIKKGYERFRPEFDAAEYRTDSNMNEVRRILSQIVQIEQSHAKELEQHAVDLAHKQTGFPKEFFHAFLNKKPDQGGSYAAQQMNPKKKETLPVDPRMRQEINKRINMNLLTQGHALHSMDALHYEIKKELEKIDKKLPELYKKLSIGTKGTYYFTNSIQAAQQAYNRAAATVGEVELAKNPKTNQVEIYASAMTFPFLVQELIKGAMDMAASHQFTGMNDKEKNTILSHADRFEDEPWHFIIGVPLWHQFLEMIPKEYANGPQMMHVVMQLARKDSQFVNKALLDAIGELRATNDKTEINNIINDLMQELKDHEEEDNQWQNQENDDDQENWKGQREEPEQEPEEDDDENWFNTEDENEDKD